MRYYNPSSRNKYCTAAHRTLPPGGVTPRGNLLSAYIERAFSESGGNIPMLDAEDAASIMRLVESTKRAREAMAMPRVMLADGLGTLERALEDMGRIDDARASAAMASIASDRAEDAAMSSQLKSEDVAIDEATGRAVATENTMRDRSHGIAPKIASSDGPVSAEDVLANNKAVMAGMAGMAVQSTDGRSDGTPLSGAEAVAARVVPGMPDFPGSRNPGGLYDTLSAEAKEARKTQMPGPGSVQRRYGLSELGKVDLSGQKRSDEMMDEIAARNFGRK